MSVKGKLVEKRLQTEPTSSNILYLLLRFNHGNFVTENQAIHTHYSPIKRFETLSTSVALVQQNCYVITCDTQGRTR